MPAGINTQQSAPGASGGRAVAGSNPVSPTNWRRSQPRRCPARPANRLFVASWGYGPTERADGTRSRPGSARVGRVEVLEVGEEKSGQVVHRLNRVGEEHELVVGGHQSPVVRRHLVLDRVGVDLEAEL